MTQTSNLHVLGVVLSATAGSVIGALVLYGIGRQLDVERMEKIIDRWGHVLRLTKEDIHKADAWFDRYGPGTVFFRRFVPLVRSLISIPAGMSNMNMGVFLFLTTLGTLIWNVVLVNLGAYFGESWDVIAHYMDVYSKVIYVVMLLLMIVFIALYIKKRRGRK